MDTKQFNVGHQTTGKGPGRAWKLTAVKATKMDRVGCFCGVLLVYVAHGGTNSVKNLRMAAEQFILFHTLPNVAHASFRHL